MNGYHWLYCCNYRFKCEKVDESDFGYTQWSCVNDNIKTIINDAVNIRDDFNCSDKPSYVMLQHMNDVRLLKTIITCKYSTFRMKITLTNDEGLPEYARFDGDYHLNVEMIFPSIIEAHGVVL